MERKKIDTKKISKLVKKAEPQKIKKIESGDVINKTISDVQKMNSKKGSKKKSDNEFPGWIEYTDHNKTHTKHTRHGKQA